ncbi:hypothetical protein [Vibrio sp. St2]|uniref:Rz1-like lysis system protein LysC n=1 Tax=Vibrio sp. St2 TaxID=2853441 RepID=UPI00248F399E|nr:hypothetical protein [Vibrio sp. St2]
MKSALMFLSLVVVSGCTTTEFVTEYKERKVLPPSAYLTKCEQPYSTAPETYGEAVARDPIWYEAWKNCAEKIDSLREFYGYDN